MMKYSEVYYGDTDTWNVEMKKIDALVVNKFRLIDAVVGHL